MIWRYQLRKPSHDILFWNLHISSIYLSVITTIKENLHLLIPPWTRWTMVNRPGSSNAAKAPAVPARSTTSTSCACTEPGRRMRWAIFILLKEVGKQSSELQMAFNYSSGFTSNNTIHQITIHQYMTKGDDEGWWRRVMTKGGDWGKWWLREVVTEESEWRRVMTKWMVSWWHERDDPRAVVTKGSGDLIWEASVFCNEWLFMYV